jgi:hypothetical protein
LKRGNDRESASLFDENEIPLDETRDEREPFKKNKNRQ